VKYQSASIEENPDAKPWRCCMLSDRVYLKLSPSMCIKK